MSTTFSFASQCGPPSGHARAAAHRRTDFSVDLSRNADPASRFLRAQNIRRVELTPTCRRQIKRKEAYLERRCGRIWLAENPQQEYYIFAKFYASKDDHIVVTLACYHPRLCRFITLT